MNTAQLFVALCLSTFVTVLCFADFFGAVARKSNINIVNSRVLGLTLFVWALGCAGMLAAALPLLWGAARPEHGAAGFLILGACQFAFDGDLVLDGLTNAIPVNLRISVRTLFPLTGTALCFAACAVSQRVLPPLTLSDALIVVLCYCVLVLTALFWAIHYLLPRSAPIARREERRLVWRLVANRASVLCLFAFVLNVSYIFSLRGYFSAECLGVVVFPVVFLSGVWRVFLESNLTKRWNALPPPDVH